MNVARTLALPLLGLLASGCIFIGHAGHSDHGEVFAVVRLEHAVAADAAATLDEMLRADQMHPGSASLVRVSADERTNAVLLRGPRPRVKELEKVLQELDVQQE